MARADPTVVRAVPTSNSNRRMPTIVETLVEVGDQRGVDRHSMPSSTTLYSVPTRNVVLTDRQAQLVQSLVDSGRYQNASEVIREGLRLVERREQEDTARLHALRSAADVGLSDLASGAFTDFDDAGSLQTYLAQVSQDVVDRRMRPR